AARSTSGQMRDWCGNASQSHDPRDARARSAGGQRPADRDGDEDSTIFELRKLIRRFIFVLVLIGGEAVLHQECILAAILVIAAEHAHRAETLRAEKQLSRQ